VRNLTVAVALLFTASALAQEIGTEISSPDRSTGQPNNPWAAPPPPPKSEPGTTAAQPQPQGAAARPADANGKVAAGAGSFGIHAGFGTSAELPSVSAPSGAASVTAAPKLGVSFFAGDNFALDVNLGFGLGVIQSLATVSLGISVEADIFFRPPTTSLRPFFAIGAGFDMGILGSRVDTGVNAQAGLGAAYFFSPNFAVSGKILLVAPFLFGNSGVTFGIFTLSPGVMGYWYF